MAVAKRPAEFPKADAASFIGGAPDGKASAGDDQFKLKGYALEAYPAQIAEVDELRKEVTKRLRQPYSRNQWIRDAISEKIERDRQKDQ